MLLVKADRTAVSRVQPVPAAPITTAPPSRHSATVHIVSRRDAELRDSPLCVCLSILFSPELLLAPTSRTNTTTRSLITSAILPTMICSSSNELPIQFDSCVSQACHVVTSRNLTCPARPPPFLFRIPRFQFSESFSATALHLDSGCIAGDSKFNALFLAPKRARFGFAIRILQTTKD